MTHEYDSHVLEKTVDRYAFSRQQVVNNLAIHICEPKITALKTMCQFRMVKTKVLVKLLKKHNHFCIQKALIVKYIYIGLIEKYTFY